MNEPLFPLEEWVAKVSVSAKKKIRTLLARFQKHWYEGHISNPLLFPMEQTHNAWKAHLDWYLTVEKFQLPGKKAAPITDTEPIPAQPEVTAASDNAETVFFSPETIGDDEKTVIYNPLDPTAQKTTIPDELGDLGTLIVESEREKSEKGEVAPSDLGGRKSIVDDKTALVEDLDDGSPVEPGFKTVIVEPEPPAAEASDKTTIIDRAQPTDRFEETDLDTLVGEADIEGSSAERIHSEEPEKTVVFDRSSYEKADAPHSQTGTSGSPDREETDPPDRGTPVAAEHRDEKPVIPAVVDKGTLIIEPDAIDQPEKESDTLTFNSPDQNRKDPKQVKKKTKRSEAAADVDLDLEDLNTLEWMDEAE